MKITVEEKSIQTSLPPNYGVMSVGAKSGGARISVQLKGDAEKLQQVYTEMASHREVELLTPVVKDEPKKWRWREVSSSRFELRFDGDRSAFAIANDCGDHWAMQCIEIGGAAKTKVDAFSAVERQLRASKDWREGDEIEPCREPVPTLALWLSRQDIYVDCDRVFTVVGFTGLPLADVRKAHAAITEYFEKYPDAEPEFRKEWEGK